MRLFLSYNVIVMLRLSLIFAFLLLVLAGCESAPIIDEAAASRALDRGKMRYQEGDFQSAAVAFSMYRSGQTEPAKLAEGFYWEGMSLLAQREFGPAKESFARAAGQEPGGWLAGYIYCGLGNALMGLGEFEEARAAYAKALDAPGDDIRLDLVLLRLATCAQRSGAWEDAEKYLEKLIAELPGSTLVGQAKEKMQYGKRRFFTIQVGAFKAEESALKEAAAMKKQGLKAFVAQIERGGEMLHCVWVGRFDSWEQANLEMQRIRGQTGIENAIVKP